MSSFAPGKELDRAIMAVQRSHAALPDLFRRLTEGELWFLLPYHPEIEGEELELKNGSPLPFAMVEDKAGAVVPLFSCETRLNEGLRKGRVPPRTYCAGAMPALQVLEILGRAKLRAILNKSCATGQVTLPPDLMCDLANGRALAPIPTGGRQQGLLRIIDPADYPTDLLQPTFELMRRHRNFRAAWIFGFAETEPQPANGHGYRLLFLMEPRDDAVFHDLNLVVQAARSPADDVQLGLIEDAEPGYVAKLCQQAPPDYVATDYQRPCPPAGLS